MNQLNNYLEDLLEKVQHSKIQNAKHLISTSSLKIFQELDNNSLQIGNQQIHFDLEFQKTELTLPIRKTDCYGKPEQVEFNIEQINELRLSRALKAQHQIQVQQEASQQRKLQILQGQLKSKILANKKPLFCKLKEQEQESVLKQQELNYNQLQAIRRAHRPLSKHDFEEHQRLYCKPHQQHSYSPQPCSYSPKKSLYYEKIEQQCRNLKQLESEKKQKLLELNQKRRSFAEEVRIKYKPKIKKQIEYQDICEQQIPSCKKVSSSFQDDKNTSYGTSDTYMPKIKRIDHWQQLAINKHISNENKNILIFEEAKRLEELSRKQEQLSRVTGQPNLETDNLLINSIKAKLTVLEN